MNLKSTNDFNNNPVKWSPKEGKETEAFLVQSGMPDLAKKNY